MQEGIIMMTPRPSCITTSCDTRLTPPKRRWLQFSLQRLLIAVSVLGLLFTWGIHRYKSAAWSCHWATHVRVDTPNEAESLIVDWLERRGLTEIPEPGPSGIPQLGRVLRNRDPRRRYFWQRDRSSYSSLYISLDVSEPTHTASAGQIAVLVGYGVGYRDIWPWETRSYKETANQSYLDFEAWFIHELPAKLSMQGRQQEK